MNNVIKFKKPQPVKPPKQPMSPGLRKALIAAGTVLAFVAVWVYYSNVSPV